jgi:ribosomal protein L15
LSEYKILSVGDTKIGSKGKLTIHAKSSSKGALEKIKELGGENHTV